MTTIQTIDNGDSGLIARSKINDNNTNLNNDKLETSLKGASNGLAELDSGGKVPTSQLPNIVQGAIRVIGTWNATTNSPNLSALTLTQGESYQVSVAGSTSLNGETNWKPKDLVVWDDALAGNYFKLDNTDDVISVNSKTGIVALDKSDIGLSDIENIPFGNPTANTTNLRSGTNALGSVTIATDSVAFGSDCAPLVTQGTRGVYVGHGVAPTLITGVDATVLGADTAQGVTELQRVTILGSLINPVGDIGAGTTFTDGIIISTGGGGSSAVKAYYKDDRWVFSDLFFSPTIQKFTSGSGTYTTPANVKYIRVRMVGGGGGGAASNTGTSGSNGAASTFGTILIANGGLSGISGSNMGGLGGTAVINSPAIGTAIKGQSGAGSFLDDDLGNGVGPSGAHGGGTALFGGGGQRGYYQTGGEAGGINTGGGGQSGGTAPNATGSGGGAGGSVDAIISTPSSSYSYTVGSGGAGGAGGNEVGGAGGSGYIEVTEYYN